MTAGQSTRSYPTVSLAPAPLASLLAVALIIGAMLGAGITLQLGSSASNTVLAGAAAHPAVTFDAIKFRAEERAPLQVPFDANKFRAEERAVTPTKLDSGAADSNLTNDRRR